MSSLQGKNILLGVSGGIAAYKIAYLVRLLVKKQAAVRVVMSESAKQFVTPLTLSTLSKNEVLDNFSNANNAWNNHIEVGLWADAMIIAPATANTIAKMAHGICDNFLIATYLSARCPVFFAPAMDLDMLQHPTTQQNIEKLQSFGNQLIPSAFGELASGLIGEGRMAEPEEICTILENYFFQEKILSGKKILITAGPTHEAIDPVRFIGNHSSGKMGIALANAAQQLGAEVTLILGPVAKQYIHSQINVVSVTSAEQMYNAVHQYFTQTDIAILAAAVADYSPKEKSEQKIKKNNDFLTLELTKTKDILQSLGEIKTTQKLIGFALETQNEIENAKEKIRRKNLDAIILNSLNDKGSGFATDTNKVTFITANMQEYPLPLMPKTQLAYEIFQFIITNCK